MPTSLEAIAKKAKEQPSYRFRDLSREINENLLRECWRRLNKRSAVGVDGVSYREYDSDLDANLSDLMERLKCGTYRAKLVRRHYIPKGNGKQRPLGIPSTEDKLLQYAVAQVLGAIYEQDFYPCSYGYRPKVGARDAVDDLQRNLNFGPFSWVVEADIRGFFDNINHDHLIAMLEERIDDQRFIRLIRKWLKAGVLETDGKVIHPATGSPQGGIVSPILANIYLHHVLVKWFEETVKGHCTGRATLCVYADDFVCAFERAVDARRFYQTLPKRMGRFGLEVAPEKTNLIQFSRLGGDANGAFEFLGFEFRWKKSKQKGNPYVKRTTSREKFRKSVKGLTQWCRKFRDLKIRVLLFKFNAKLRGYYNYYGVPGNMDSMWQFSFHAHQILYKWLNRRSQRKSYNWDGFTSLLEACPLIKPRVVMR
ncbi:MAG: group II intron reverse transcriptase/maturase [Planctomycetes bacterium]|nr:group II intron reverse transcriptase/maturase [Planctomycetota bacterium]